jgi:hypothetical protein
VWHTTCGSGLLENLYLKFLVGALGPDGGEVELIDRWLRALAPRPGAHIALHATRLAIMISAPAAAATASMAGCAGLGACARACACCWESAHHLKPDGSPDMRFAYNAGARIVTRGPNAGTWRVPATNS